MNNENVLKKETRREKRDRRVEPFKKYAREIEHFVATEIKRIKQSLKRTKKDNYPEQLYLIERGKDFLAKIMKHIAGIIEVKRGILQQLEQDITKYYFDKIKDNTNDMIKTEIRNIQNSYIRKAINAQFRIFKERLILEAIKEKIVSWNSTLTKDKQYGVGMDERIIEFPLALEVGDFSSAGKVLDAGSSLNISYIREFIGMPVAHIVHFTQSAENELLQADNDKVSYMFGDLRCMDFKDGVFDRILCVSTIEHIGMDNSRYGGSIENNPESYINAIKEMLRVLKQGGRLMLTFPYGKAVNFGWYHILDKTDVQRILELCKSYKCQKKYFYYDGVWYENNEIYPGSEKQTGKEITGLAALLITKLD